MTRFRDQFKNPRLSARQYLQKAKDLQKGAEAMVAAGNATAAALLSVRAGVLAVDAITVYYHWGTYSDGSFTELLRRLALTGHPRQASLAGQLSGLLGRKYSIESGENTIGARDARAVVTQAAKILDAANEILRDAEAAESNARRPPKRRQ